jgi:hypothetical protein
MQVPPPVTNLTSPPGPPVEDGVGRMRDHIMKTGIGILFGAALLAQASTALAQGGDGGSVASAWNALRAKPGVTFSTQDGWTIVKDTDDSSWSFTPASHYAHPSVGHRRLLQHQDRFYVRTELVCQATKAACDRLFEDYQLLDRRMNEAIAKGK